MIAHAKEQEVVEAAASLAAWSAVRVPYADIDALRAQPSPAGGKTLPARFLKNSDEQTVAGMAAVLRAIHQAGWNDRSFADWAVLGAPQFLGRLAVTGVINRYVAEPTYSVSPHIIPNQCLHSISGTVSVGLGIRGPNYGVGGGRGAAVEALLAALSLLKSSNVAGVWLVMTAFDPEPIPDEQGKPTNSVDVIGAAVALTRKGHGIGIVRLIRDLTSGQNEAKLTEVIRRLESSDRRKILGEIEGLGRIMVEWNP